MEATIMPMFCSRLSGWSVLLAGMREEICEVKVSGGWEVRDWVAIKNGISYQAHMATGM